MLTPKQEKFCQEYIIDLNATQAAIRAGYSEKTAKSMGSENLSKPDIQDYINEVRGKLAEKTGITTERILNEFAKVAFFDIRTVYDEKNNCLMAINRLGDEAAGAVSGVEIFEEFEGFGDARTHIGNTVKLKIHNKISALDSLAKHLGMFEKDNAQKKPLIALDLSKMTPIELKSLVSIKKKMNG